MSAAQSVLIVVALLESATFGALLFALFKHLRLLADFARVPAGPTPGSTCLLIRPCAGEEPHLLECLLSVVEAKCDVRLRIFIGVDHAEDPALKTAKTAQAELVKKGFDVTIVQAPILGPNRKASIVAECIRLAGRDFEAVIVADSNVDLGGFDLNRMLALLLKDAGTGAVWAPFREEASPSAFGNIASKAVLHFSWHSFGLLSRMDPGGMVGKLFAVRKEALHTVDDFRSLVRFLGEDMELCRALGDAGYIVRSVPMTVRSPCGPKSWKDTVDRQVRWMMVIKAQRPALLISYPMLFFNALVMVASSAACAPFSPLLSGIVLYAAVLLRIGVGYTAARMLSLRPKASDLLFGILIADVLLVIAFIKALGTRRFNWRGRWLTISGGGELKDVG